MKDNGLMDNQTVQERKLMSMVLPTTASGMKDKLRDRVSKFKMKLNSKEIGNSIN